MPEQLGAADRRCAASANHETTSEISQRGGQRHGGLRGECKAQDGYDRVTGADDIIDLSGRRAAVEGCAVQRHKRHAHFGPSN